MGFKNPEPGEIKFVVNNLINIANALEDKAIGEARAITRLRHEIDDLKEMFGLDTELFTNPPHPKPEPRPESALDITPFGGRSS